MIGSTSSAKKRINVIKNQLEMNSTSISTDYINEFKKDFDSESSSAFGEM